ncbi:MAG TPA: HD-GYP domain-containing protein [Armatimonadota bacterium]
MKENPPPTSGRSQLLKIGDVLAESLYGWLPGAQAPVLLMAAGQRIETAAQLRRLREGGYSVDLPEEPDLFTATVKRAPTSTAHAEFQQRLQAAAKVHTVAVQACRDLIERVRVGHLPERAILENASEMLVNQVIQDPLAMTALTYLHRCDDYTIEHSANVSILMAAIAQVLELPDSERKVLALAGLMHDVGKQRVPLKTLSKSGPLSNEEFAQIWRHPLHGADILDELEGCPPVVREVAVQHHERLNGAGYPYGLTGDMLSLGSRIAAVADTFDAMTANRVYRQQISAREAILDLFASRGRLLDTRAVMALIRLVGVYPVGTRVLLNTGEGAIVVAPNPRNSARPTVVVDRDPAGRAIPKPFSISFRSDAYRIVGAVQ